MSIIDPRSFGINLSEINADRPYCERSIPAFPDDWEMQRAAYVVIWFLQSRDNGYEPFSRQELLDFLRDQQAQPGLRTIVKDDLECFEKLVSMHFIVGMLDGLHLTEEFIERCKEASRTTEAIE